MLSRLKSNCSVGAGSKRNARGNSLVVKNALPGDAPKPRASSVHPAPALPNSKSGVSSATSAATSAKPVAEEAPHVPSVAAAVTSVLQAKPAPAAPSSHSPAPAPSTSEAPAKQETPTTAAAPAKATGPVVNVVRGSGKSLAEDEDTSKIRAQNAELRRRLKTLLVTMTEDQKEAMFAKNPSLLALMQSEDAENEEEILLAGRPAPQSIPASSGPNVGRTEDAVPASDRFNPRVGIESSSPTPVAAPARPTTSTTPPRPGSPSGTRPPSPTAAPAVQPRAADSSVSGQPPLTPEEQAAMAQLLAERKKLEEEQARLRALEEQKKAAQRKAEEEATMRALEAKRAEEAKQAAVKAQELAKQKALDEIATFDAASFFKGKGEWLYHMVPMKPVAGQPLTIYFNRARSETLRHRGHIVLKGGYNDWEVPMPEVNFLPAPNVTRDGGQDWWCARVESIPRDVYNLSYVLHDTQGLFENNNTANFNADVLGGVSREEWLEIVAEREVEREKQRLAEEEKKRLEEAKSAEQKKLDEDRNRAKHRVQEQLKQMNWLQGGAPYDKLEINKTLVWEIETAYPKGLQAGEPFTLYYNADAGPLKNSTAIRAKIGFNSWKGATEIPMTKVERPAPGTWWTCQHVLPEEAMSMNFVTVNERNVYDNNNRQDYRASVNLPAWTKGDTAAWAEKMEKVFEEQERAERLKREEEERLKQQEREEKLRFNREKALAVLKKQMKHIVFTEPMDIVAGEEVKIYYNPKNTVLSGRTQVFIRGGFNRWSHPKTFGPIEMKPPGPGGEHYEASITVPQNAYKLDFVFSDTGSDSGTFDNRGGYDYHLPVKVAAGFRVKEKPLHIIHVAVEMAPVAKVGGLGDVVTSLGRAISEEGHMVEVILPRFRFFDDSPILRGQIRFETEFDWGGTRIVVTSAMVENLRVFLVEPQNGFFNTPTVYGRYDDGIRFDFFCKAALEFLIRTGRQPDILHCHDWSTASVAKYYWDDYHPYGLGKPRVVFTIHNLEFGQQKIGEAAMNAQRFTTVSPTYAFEIAGHPAVRPHTAKFVGIRNGIDPELWNPEDDKFLPMHYTSRNHEEGKKAARMELRKRLNLTTWQDRPMIGVVTRLTAQKGMHLIKHACWRTLDRGGQFVLLGSAPDPRVQADFNNWANNMRNEHCAFNFAFDEPLSHLIYAACDFILVPSMFEPCGLTQLIAMRYGAIPVVRHTGGLKDTVFDVDCDKERAAWDLEGSDNWKRDNVDCTNGFAFDGTDAGAFDYAMNRALDAFYNDPKWFRSLQGRVMDQDWSWSRPALDYIDLYYAAAKN